MNTKDEFAAIHKRMDSISVRLWGIYGLLATMFVALWLKIGGVS